MVDDDVERMRAYTASGEHLLWVGRPDTSAHFSRHDLVLIPFSLVWCAFFAIMPLGTDGVPWLFALPFLAMAVWLLFGRFVYKTWRQARTLYALTDQRALIKTGDRVLRDFPLRHAPVRVEHTAGRRRVSVWFGGPTPSLWGPGVYENTGMDAFLPDASKPFAFYDVSDADALVRGLSEARTAANADRA